MIEEGLKDWTVMIYMAGDNNLSADMSYALSDLKKAAARNDENVNLFVFFDSSPINAPSYYFDFTNPEEPVHQLVNSVDNPFDRDSEPNRNSAAVYTLMNFVNWCVNDTTLRPKKGKRSTVCPRKYDWLLKWE